MRGKRKNNTRSINLVENSIFEVEKIVSKKVEDGKTLYQIKWKGYSITDNTWEPIEHLNIELINAYEKRIAEEESIVLSDDSDKEENNNLEINKNSSQLLNKKRERENNNQLIQIPTKKEKPSGIKNNGSILGMIDIEENIKNK
jgi:hypothetical protein